MKRIITVLTVAALVLGAGTVLAAGFGPSHRGHRGMGPGGPGPGMELHHWMRVADKLDLSDTQRDQIEAILETARPSLEQHAEAMRELHEQLRDADPTTLDETAVRALARQQAQHMEESMVLRFQVRSQIRSVLTEDQISQLDECRAERKERHQRFRGCMRANDAS